MRCVIDACKIMMLEHWKLRELEAVNMHTEDSIALDILPERETMDRRV